MKEVAVPQGVYRHLQGGFAINNARMSVKSGTNLWTAGYFTLVMHS